MLVTLIAPASLRAMFAMELRCIDTMHNPIQHCIKCWATGAVAIAINAQLAFAMDRNAIYFLVSSKFASIGYFAVENSSGAFLGATLFSYAWYAQFCW